MTISLQPEGRAMLIGSQPLRDHAEAMRLVLTHVPEIPNWVQLPALAHEGMVTQFVSGMPGLVRGGDRLYVDTAAARFDDEILLFFEEYLAVHAQEKPLAQSRFRLNPEDGPGFFELLSALRQKPSDLYAVKGQITGPITFCTGLTDQNRRAIFYHETLREAAVKMIALKAGWQVQRLRSAGVPVIVFIDEPAMAGYGSSEMISISREDIGACLREVNEAIHREGGWSGVHVCANTDWSLLLDAGVDIVNFDAYGYFDKFMLYADRINAFLKRGGCLAWGMVPTALADQVAAATLEDLWAQWCGNLERMAVRGIDPVLLRRRSFITPSCGTGSLTPELSAKVLSLTRALSARIRESHA